MKLGKSIPYITSHQIIVKLKELATWLWTQRLGASFPTVFS